MVEAHPLDDRFLKRFGAYWYLDRGGAGFDHGLDWSFGWTLPRLAGQRDLPGDPMGDEPRTDAGGWITLADTGAARDDSTPVTAPAVLPGDSGFTYQWHLWNPSGVDLNVAPVWDDYTGAGVVVGVIDDGIHYNHPDLAPNYRSDIDWDARDNDADSLAGSGDSHGTAVSGVIAAEENNGGLVGVAYDADLTMFRMGFGANGSQAQELAQMQNIAGVDVSNSSWGYNGYFYDNFDSPTFAAIGQAIEDAAANGRGGLGTVMVFAAGNEGGEGQNTNYHSYQNSPYEITVGALDSNGDAASFTTPGATVLVSAPGVGIYTTYPDPSYYAVASGTSFSAPAVSGVVALMLEANPDLGYRDVQQILAYSAWNTDPTDPGWQTNGAADWNGGGLTVDDSYGFGLVDAHAAVRLAETWSAQSTFANLQTVSQSSSPGTAISSTQTVVDTVTFSAGLDIDWVQVDLDISHTWIGDLTVSLTSPDGTVSLLVDRPGVGDPDLTSLGTSQNNISFTLGSVQFWGEDGVGDWTLAVSDAVAAENGTLLSWSLVLLGDVPGDDDTYVFTDEWSGLGTLAGRQTLVDTAGTDTLNFAALTDGLTIDLTPGSTQSLLGNPLTFDAGSLFENAWGGDGDDVFTGNAAGNALYGMRGDDSLRGGGGDDLLDGGADGASGDTAVFAGVRGDYAVSLDQGVYTLVGPDGTDQAVGIEWFAFDNGTSTETISVDDILTVPTLPDLTVQSLSADNTNPDAGATITVDVTVWNQGDGAAGANETRIYLSDDATIDASDTLLATAATGALAADATEGESEQVTLPGGLSGTYYIGALTDAGAAVAESDETNNAASLTIDIAPVVQPFAPSAISGLVQWLDAADAATLTDAGSDGDLDLWADKGGSGNDGLGLAGGRDPMLAASSFNGLDAVSFDGVDDALQVADTLDLNTGASYDGRTIAVAFQTGADVAARQVVYEEGGALRGLNLYIDGGSLYLGGWNLAETVWGPSFLDAAVSADTGYVATLTFDGAAGTLSGTLNGVSMGTVAADTLYIHSGDIGLGAMLDASYFHDGAASGSGFSFAGDIGELVQYDRALGGAEQALVEGYLMDKWVGDYTPPPFAPSAISGLVQWLDAADAATLTDAGSDGDLDLWADKGGSGNDGLGLAGGRDPMLAAASFNGLDAVSFDGVDDALQVADTLDLNTGASYDGRTIAVAFQTGADVAARQVVYEEGGALRGLNLYIDGGSLYLGGWNLAETVWGPSFLDAAVSADTGYVATLTFDGAAGTLSGTLNGVSMGTVAADTLYIHGGDIGLGAMLDASYFHDGDASGSGFSFAGEIGELVQYDRALDGAEQAQVESYLMDKWTGDYTPPPNQPPMAVDDGPVKTVDGAAVVINVLANDTDAEDGQPTLVGVQTQGTHGLAVANVDGTITYTPDDPAYVGADSFVYEVTDSDGETDQATVTIDSTVAPPFAPSAISGLVQWLDAADAATLTDAGSDGDLDLWADKGGSGNDGLGLAGGRDPMLAASSFNGLDAVSFDGVDDALQVADTLDLNTGASYDGRTIAVAFQTGADVAARQVVYEEGGALRGLNLYIDGGSLYLGGWNLAETVWGPSFLDAAVSADTGYVATLTFDGAAGTLSGTLNGVSMGTVAADTLYIHSGDIGLGAMLDASYFHDGAASGSGFSFAGDIGELVQYDRALGGAEQALVEGYLMDKWVGDYTPPPFAPSAISGLVQWLDAADAATLTDAGSDGDLDLWADKGGSGNDGLGLAGGRDPMLAAASFNGLDAVSFDGVDDALQVADTLDLNTGASYDGRTIAVAFQTGADVAARQVVYEEGGGLRGLNLYIDGGSLYLGGWNLAETVWGPSFLDAAVSADTGYVATLTFDGAAGTLSGTLNGVSMGTVAADTLYIHGGDIGLGAMLDASYFHDGDASGSGFSFAGEIGELVQYDRALNGAEQGQVEGYLMDKWLPGGAPAALAETEVEVPPPPMVGEADGGYSVVAATTPLTLTIDPLLAG
ncbi:MAG: S8 family serine peptidase [Hyphomicrobiales bacterium]|nr:S8 family serine peptidase [Hyphomicrobiales bacterium]